MHTATLTRIRLNLRHPAVRRDLADYPGLHKTLMRLAPDHLGPQPRRQAGLLFRLDPHLRQPTLLVQTTTPPDLAALPSGYGTADTRDLTPLLTALRPGQRVHYRITANPSARAGQRPTPTPADTSARRRPRPVIALHGNDAMAWWRRRAEMAGLALESATMLPRDFRRPHRSQPGPCHRLVQFDGTAHITDAAALADALCTGIGKTKSYGAGLLSLAPA
ncbi:type I-E CRISPR-associated protein Cas6/Cse3/CasE [Streptomyces sp. NPDC001820]|uniref:type I-E CRISPR-associated protein Cas6/Cse3/CasE n=1 Tax=Streptomyces sp. NPDC001820 TaxID=3364613 RepID=UPI0036A42378